MTTTKPIRAPRKSCDRCHGQKLKCLKLGTAGTCIRCQRAHAECIFSLPNRMSGVRPPRPSFASAETAKLAFGTPISEDEVATVEISALDDGLRDTEMDAQSQLPRCNDDWLAQPMLPLSAAQRLPWDFGQDIELDLTPQSMTSMSSMTTDSTPSASSYSAVTDKEFTFEPYLDHGLQSELSLSYFQPAIPTSFAVPRVPSKNRGTGVAPMAIQALPAPNLLTYIKLLSELSVELAEHFHSIPPISCHDEPRTLESQRAEKECRGLESTYAITQRVIDIYPKFLKLLQSTSKSQHPHATVIAQATSAHHHSPAFPAAVGAKPATTTIIDTASTHLLLSVHYRLIDIYDLLLAHARRATASRSMLPSDPLAEVCDTPTQIGGYQPNCEMSVMLQFAVLCEFARVLKMLAGRLVRVVELDGKRVGKGAGEDEIGGIAGREETLARSLAAACCGLRERAEGMCTEAEAIRDDLAGHLYDWDRD